jgi:hypothetical protein
MSRTQSRPRAVVGEDLYLSEVEVMLAMAEWLFTQGACHATIHPDGMHLLRYDLSPRLERDGFRREGDAKAPQRLYRRGETTLTVYSRPGLGDVTAEIRGQTVQIETKGGYIASGHAGRRSRLRSGLSEVVGQLMASQRQDARLIAAVPDNAEIERVAQRMAVRCALIGIEIALVDERGSVRFVEAAA